MRLKDFPLAPCLAASQRLVAMSRKITALLFLMPALLLGAEHASARVLSYEIDRRVPILAGQPLGETDAKGAGQPLGETDAKGAGQPHDGADAAGAAYELIEGRVLFEFDPDHRANARVTDIRLAPRNARGQVEAEADFVVLQPLEAKRRSGTALIDVPNRGRRLVLSGMNRVQKGFNARATLDPDSALDWGDEFLMSRGLSVMWVGWQADVPAFPGAIGLRVPTAVEADGTPVRGRARSDWVVDAPQQRLELAALGHTPHRAAEPGSALDQLTRRRGREATREPVDRAAWRFDESREAIEATGTPFEPGWIYELVYAAEGPPLVGLGFAAFRDFASWVENDPDCPFPAKRSVAHGLSQSGRFLRHLLYEGFNQDEAGRRVFDAMMIQIGGGGRGGFNHRFSHPGRVGNPYANFFYPGDDFPFTSRPQTDGDRNEGLFDRAVASETLPRVFQINTGYEYWGRGASLVQMSPDGSADVAPHPNERLYHIASAPHFSLPFPPDPRSEVRPGLFTGSSIDTSPFQRALLIHLLDWVERDVAPPPSAIPTIAAGSLVAPAALRYPIADLRVPRTPHLAYRNDYGPGWSQGIVAPQPPPLGKPYAIRVPAIDRLGNEVGGLRALELRAPIATYLPWSLRHGRPGSSNEMAGYIGSFLPLALDAQGRRTGDQRPPLDGLYPTRDAYETRVVAQIDALVEAGWMLPRDRRRAFEAALVRWEWARGRAPTETAR